MNDKIEQDVYKVQPLKKICMTIGELPSSYLETMTYYEMLIWFTNFLRDNIIPTVNNNAEAVKELQNLFIELQKYVNNYFDNLDVQDEINNKLDQMLEDGVLEEIIEQYLNSSAIWGFDTVADMKSATNLIDGSFAKTLGYYSANDRGEATYKIRTITNDDVIDEGSIIALNDNTLIAELIIENEINVKQFGAYGDNTHDDTLSIQNAINYAQDNNVKLIINNGTFLVKTLLINEHITIEGVDFNKSILKSLDNNEDVTQNEGLLNIKNNGMKNSKISNFTLDGNKSNQTLKFDGLYCWSNTDFDTHTLIENIIIKNFTGNGLTITGNVGGRTLRENILNKLDISYNDENGINITSSTDSYFNEIASYSNNKLGFRFYYGGSHKISNCKAYWNGQGDNTTIDIERTPASAYQETNDEYKNPSKTYYTRSGLGKWYNPYVFTEYTSNEFEDDVTYYECTKNYYKKYQGFGFFHTSSVAISNCESQDNMADGFLISESSDIVMSSVIGDNNGLLRINNVTVSYTAAGLEQIYLGIYIYKSNNVNVNGEFRNFRQQSIGKCQRAGIGNRQSSYVNGNIVASDQIEEYYRYNPSQKTNYIIINGHIFEEYWDLTDCTIASGYEVYNPRDLSNRQWDESYLKKVGNTISYRILIRKSDSSNIPTSDVTDIFRLPANWTPTSIVNIYAFLSPNHGSSNNGVVGCSLGRDSKINYRYPSSATASAYLVMDGSFELDY